jgi:hypothetical protein
VTNKKSLQKIHGSRSGARILQVLLRAMPIRSSRSEFFFERRSRVTLRAIPEGRQRSACNFQISSKRCCGSVSCAGIAFGPRIDRERCVGAKQKARREPGF